MDIEGVGEEEAVKVREGVADAEEGVADSEMVGEEEAVKVLEGVADAEEGEADAKEGEGVAEKEVELETEGGIQGAQRPSGLSHQAGKGQGKRLLLMSNIANPGSF